MAGGDQGERIAVLEAKQREQAEDIKEIKSDVKTILAALNMGQGAWKAALLIGGAITAVIGLLAALADKLHFWK